MPEQLAALLAELEALRLFDLKGTAKVPSALPPGCIAVEAGERKFFVTLQHLEGKEDSRVFSRAAYRIVAATQGGPHYALPK
jgi:hypothetical protein